MSFEPSSCACGQGGRRSAGPVAGGTPWTALPSSDHRPTIARGTRTEPPETTRSPRPRPLLTPRYGDTLSCARNAAFVVVDERNDPKPRSPLMVPVVRGFRTFGSHLHHPHGPSPTPVEPAAETRITPELPDRPEATGTVTDADPTVPLRCSSTGPQGWSITILLQGGRSRRGWPPVPLLFVRLVRDAVEDDGRASPATAETPPERRSAVDDAPGMRAGEVAR